MILVFVAVYVIVTDDVDVAICSVCGIDRAMYNF